MPTSISIASGKFAVYRNADSSGASPFTNILVAANGAACVLKDSCGKVWVFYITGAKLYCKISTDTEGTDYDSPITIEDAAIKDGVPTAIELPTGKIMVVYWKTVSSVDKWYQASTIDYGANWVKTEITTA